ncbi:hypothetical protein M011DRAFT_490678 [Sporormia fimetaria CBS 119925]|uniref:Uncharacterized protein n=1 Tax=Sporormia fimetaria CBS 119925 TaxID=1340428 RepID=A0A6A6UVX0_9PLEO|nr:hypothetical protein M011DRAFT_490678 [Sporormia fimetaria CBS 119925]
MAAITIQQELSQDVPTLSLSPYAPTPEIFVDGQRIPQTLSEEDVRLCIHMAQPASCGSKRTWALNPSDFHISSGAWTGYVDEMLESVARDLTIEQPEHGLRAELEKMMLFEEGAVEEGYLEPENSSDAFGTLVVPVEASRAFTWWPSKMAPEALPVSKGTKLALVYKLVADSSVEEGAQSLAVRAMI